MSGGRQKLKTESFFYLTCSHFFKSHLIPRSPFAMPTLAAIGVHPDVCGRLMVASNGLGASTPSSRLKTTTDTDYDEHTASNDTASKLDEKNPGVAPGSVRIPSKAPGPRRIHRTATPISVLKCPLDKLWMLDDRQQPLSIPLTKAARLRKDIAHAMIGYYSSHGPESTVETPHGKSLEKNETQGLEPDARHLKRMKYSVRLKSMRERIHEAQDTLQVTFTRLSTGCPRLDEILVPPCRDPVHHPNRSITDPSHLETPDDFEAGRVEGGIPLGSFTHVTGAPGSGKTQFICHLCKHRIADDQRACVWLVSSSPVILQSSRIAQMVEAMNIPIETKRDIIKRINMKTFCNEWELLSILAEIETNLRQPMPSSSILLVIDALGPYDLDSSLATRIIGRLRYLAQRYNVGVIIVESSTVDTVRTSSFRPRQRNNGRGRMYSGDIHLRLSRVRSHEATRSADRISFVVEVECEHSTPLNYFVSEQALKAFPKQRCELNVLPKGIA